MFVHSSMANLGISVWKKTLKWNLLSLWPPKDTFLRQFASFQPVRVKIGRPVRSTSGQYNTKAASSSYWGGETRGVIDHHKFCPVVGYHEHNQLCKIWSWWPRSFQLASPQKTPSSTGSVHRPYNVGMRYRAGNVMLCTGVTDGMPQPITV